jgi:hypothetical protein
MKRLNDRSFSGENTVVRYFHNPPESKIRQDDDRAEHPQRCGTVLLPRAKPISLSACRENEGQTGHPPFLVPKLEIGERPVPRLSRASASRAERVGIRRAPNP